VIRNGRWKTAFLEPSITETELDPSLAVCKVCYDIIDIDGFDDVIHMNIDGKLQEVTRIRKL